MLTKNEMKLAILVNSFVEFISASTDVTPNTLDDIINDVRGYVGTELLMRIADDTSDDESEEVLIRTLGNIIKDVADQIKGGL